MKFLLFTLACVAAVTFEGELSMFNDFKQTYGKTYETAKAETHAFECFLSNMQMNEKLNALPGDAIYGINQFADLCAEDFKVFHNLKAPQNVTYDFLPAATVGELKAVPSNADWRKKGAVTHIKNQGHCGSCWSFSSTGNMEGQVFLKTGNLISLSEEELVQCARNGPEGCHGGWMDEAFEWVVKNGGIDSERNYPYTSGTGYRGRCDEQKTKKDVSKITGHKDILHEESQMKAFVAKSGPLSIALDAARGWQTYRGGIMKGCTGRSLDHAVLIVGYDTAHTPPYWIVKNSWGASWGENGYIRLEYGTNQCGLTGRPCTSIA